MFFLVVVTESSLYHNNNQWFALLTVFCHQHPPQVAGWLCKQPQATPKNPHTSRPLCSDPPSLPIHSANLDGKIIICKAHKQPVGAYMKFTAHGKDRVTERDISEVQILQAISKPTFTFYDLSSAANVVFNRLNRQHLLVDMLKKAKTYGS